MIKITFAILYKIEVRSTFNKKFVWFSFVCGIPFAVVSWGDFDETDVLMVVFASAGFVACLSSTVVSFAL
jgi:hypothetical protein